MIFGLVTFVKIKLHPSSSITRSANHQVVTQFIFVGDVGKLEDGNLDKLGRNM